jgi:hypothetical protein
MKIKLSLLALLAGSSLVALASPALAQEAPDTDEVAAKAAFLEAQVESLQQQIDELKKGVSKAAEASKSSDWASSTKIGGKLFFNVSNISQKSDGLNTNANGFQTDVKRFYLTVDHKFDDVFSANLTTDFNYISNDSQTQVYVKKVYLQAKLSDALIVRVGSSDLPWIPFVENIYGYRHIESTLADRTKYGTSADYGVHIAGSFANGVVSYAASAINGAGYKKLVRSDSIDLEGRISVAPIKGLVFAVGGYTGKLGKSLANAPVIHRATRVNALAAYTGSRFNIGAEFFQAKNWNNVTTVTEDKTNGFSVFGSFNVTPKIAIFGRYDKVNPNKLTNAAADDNYFNVGVNFQAFKNIDLALVYKREKVDNVLLSTSNGSIGGVNEGTYDEVGLFGQVKF